MKKAICVGINNYPGTANDLKGCINDATDWDNLLKSFGFETELILDNQATKHTIVNKFDNLVTQADAGDVIVFTYSGHGTSVNDTSGDETDGYDEALYVYDGVLLDDSLRTTINKVKPGVQITVISDSCFSGTVTRALDADTPGQPRFFPTDVIPPGAIRVKSFLSDEDMAEVLVTGCDDSEYSYDAYINGRWSGAMSANAINVIKTDFNQTYLGFYNKLRDLLPSDTYPQTPQLEGSSKNKSKKLFEPIAEPGPTPDPGSPPEPDQEPDTSNWFSKYWWVILIAVVVIIVLWLNC